MSAKQYFWALAFLLLATLVGIGYILYHHHVQGYFIILQAVAFLFITLLILLYRKCIRPINTINLGLGLLNEEDFNTRLSLTGIGDVDTIIALFNKMMEQLREKQIKLKEQNYFLELLINSSPMGIIILDLDEKILSFNPAAATVIAITGEEGRAITALQHPIAAALAALPKGSSKVIRLDNGEIYKCTKASFLNSGFNQSFFLIEKMTEEVMLAERKAYEQVIRVIAHEVNNSMASISSSIEVVSHIIEAAPLQEKESVEVLNSSAERCVNLSHFISKFADVVKIPEPTKTAVEVNHLILKNMKLYESLAMDKHIRFHLQQSPTPVTIQADLIQLEQVLVNIVKNGIEAIEQEGDITFTIASNTLTISNNGAPIDDASAQHLFSPFFTTKPKGQGLGLLITREILTKHQFTFSLKSQSDGVTCFVMGW